MIDCADMYSAHRAVLCKRIPVACGANQLMSPASVSQVDGASHVVHVEEEAAGTRLTLGAGTCLLANEADPSRLTSTSSGTADYETSLSTCCFLCMCWSRQISPAAVT
jgi:hypothetical protein